MKRRKETRVMRGPETEQKKEIEIEKKCRLHLGKAVAGPPLIVIVTLPWGH